MLHPIRDIIDGQPTFDNPLPEILAECKKGGALKILDPIEYITERQRAWWKGILLPQLSQHTGDSVEWWETRLKLAVMPDDFKPFYVAMGKQVMPVIPSITKLGKKKMIQLIKGSVAHLRDEEIYRDEFLWITEPNEELRSK